MVGDRLPDEAALFAASLGRVIREATADAGYEGTAEADLSTRQKSLIADLAAKALILPAMSKYKKSLAEAEGDGAGKAKFADKLDFLKLMGSQLTTSIANRTAALSTATDSGVAMIVVTDE
ncbi:MAG: hypothetical protein WA003_08220 [Desulfuromonadaceae bacterium]